jgi:hypothetical protein
MALMKPVIYVLACILHSLHHTQQTMASMLQSSIPFFLVTVSSRSNPPPTHSLSHTQPHHHHHHVPQEEEFLFQATSV